MPPVTRPCAGALVLTCAALCALTPFRARTQESAPRRLTDTPPESTSLNPSLSGDGAVVVFESNAPAADAPGRRGFQAMSADIPSASLTHLAASRAPAAAVSQDGKTAAFASKDDPIGLNPDGNSEIFLSGPAGLSQLTDTRPEDATARTTQGSFQPSISDDGRLLAFASNRDLTGENPDRNGEIFLLDTDTRALTQLTRTAAPAESSDAKISGDGSVVAFIRRSDDAAGDLIIFDRAAGAERVAAEHLEGIALPYGRAISDDGRRVVFSASEAKLWCEVDCSVLRGSRPEAIFEKQEKFRACPS